MKNALKYLLWMPAVIAMLASCSQNDEWQSANKEEICFTLKLDADRPTSRAATHDIARYVVAVYENINDDAPILIRQSANNTLNVNLKKGEYTCLFWADCGDMYYDISNLKAVKCTTSSDGKNGEAFSLCTTIIVGDDATTQSQSINLVRAVAKVSLKKIAGNQAEGANVTIKYSRPATFSVVDGTIDGTEEVKTSFENEGAIIDGNLPEIGTFYVPAPAADPETRRFEIEVAKGGQQLDTYVRDVPLQANFKINILPAEKDIRTTLTLGDGEEKARIACVGNSITEGSGVKNPAVNGYPAQLEGLLKKVYGDDKIEVKNLGRSGATAIDEGANSYMTGEGIQYPTYKERYEEALAFNPHIVVIKLGTNDSRDNFWGQYGSQCYKRDVKKLIDSFYNNAQTNGITPVFYLCYPAMTTDDNVFGIKNTTIENEIIPKIIEIAREETAAGKNVYVIDTHYNLLDPTQDEFFVRETDTNPDGTPKNDHVHPNSKGAALLAQKICEIIRKTLTIQK